MNKIRIGYTAGGYEFGGDKDCASGEIRYIYKLDHRKADRLLDMNRKNNIFTILNIDLKKVSWSTPDPPDPNQWYLEENEYKNYARSLIVKALNMRFTEKTLAFTTINEPTKYYKSKYGRSWYDYTLYIKWLNELLKEFNYPFKIGIGNDEGHKKEFYDYVCLEAKKYYQIIYYHLQACCLNKANTNNVLYFMQDLSIRYGKRISCNEATWYDTQTADGWNYLLWQIKQAESIDTEDFCLFIDYDSNKISSFKAEFKLRGIPRDLNKWTELKRIMLEKKGGDVKMYLKELSIDDTGFQVRSLQSALNVTNEAKLKVDGWFGEKTGYAVGKFNLKENISSKPVCSYSTWYELLQSINTEVIVRDLIDLIKVIE